MSALHIGICFTECNNLIQQIKYNIFEMLAIFEMLVQNVQQYIDNMTKLYKFDFKGCL